MALQVLIVCHRYPPDDAGGYPQLCFEVAQGLKALGHQVQVLTTIPQTPVDDSESAHINRLLDPEVNYTGDQPAFIQQLTSHKRQRHNEQVFKQLATHFKPQVALFWPSETMTKSLFELAENELAIPTAYYLAGYSPLEPGALHRYWLTRARSWWKRWPKHTAFWGVQRLGLINLDQPQLQLRHVACVSQYEQRHAVNTGISADNSRVIYNGINLEEFQFIQTPSARRNKRQTLRLLYAGRLTWDKGAHVILQALEYLIAHCATNAISLTILGKGDPDYTTWLQQLIVEQGLSSNVEIVDWIPRFRIADFMSSFDALVLPTIRADALPRVVQEAMAVGLIVIGTLTGGTPEILFPEKTGLPFPPEDAQALAKQILRVYADMDLCDQMAFAARKLVEEQFTIDNTVRRIEKFLYDCVQESSP